MALRDLLNDQAGNARRGQRYRNVVRGGQQVHDYASGPDVAVGPVQHAVAAGGQGHVPAGPAPVGQTAGEMPAGNLADLIAGQRAYEAQGGQGGPVLGPHMHDAAGPDASVGHNAQGQQFSAIQVGGRKFHVYFSPDGHRIVRELPREQAFTPTPA